MSQSISLAVWDVPIPVVAGMTFAIKVGAKAADGEALAGRGVEVSDASGTTVVSGTLGSAPLPGTEALYWCVLDVPAPAAAQLADYAVRLAGGAPGAVETRFSVVAAPQPEHSLTVKVTERDSAEALADVEIRIGPFHARTDKSGRAELRLSKGDYQLKLWRTAYFATPQKLTIDGDADLALTMTFVLEEHPDARWVR